MARKRVEAELPLEKTACVGSPVQYHTEEGPLCGLLARESLTEPGTWDVALFRVGMLAVSWRSGVRQSEQPLEGCFTLLR